MRAPIERSDSNRVCQIAYGHVDENTKQIKPKNWTSLKRKHGCSILPLFLSRSHFDCTVGVDSREVAVSTCSDQIMFFVTGRLQMLLSAKGQVFRLFDSGAPVEIPHWLKCAGRTTERSFAWASQATLKLSLEASSAGLLMDGTRPNHGNKPNNLSYLTKSLTMPAAAGVAPSARTRALCAAVLSK